MLEWIRSIWQRFGGESVEVGEDLASQGRESVEFAEQLTKAHLHLRASQPESALLWVSSALQINPQSSLAHSMAAAVQQQLHDEESALDHLTLAVYWTPDDWELVSARASLLERMNQGSRAVAAIEVFLSTRQEHPAATYRLARLNYAIGRHDEALHLLRRLLLVDPENVDALNLLGLIEGREFGRLGEAERVLTRALTISPGQPEVLSNLGWVQSEQGRTNEGIASFDAVLQRDSVDHESRLMRSYANLRNGAFSEGWKDFDARHFSPLAPIQRVEEKSPCDSLKSMRGKRVFVVSEQGLGDQIMFASCFPDLLAVAGACAADCDSRLVTLFQRAFPAVKFLGRDPHESATKSGWFEFDCQIPLGSLPRFFRNAWDDFPSHRGYLRADPIKVVAWQKRLAELGPGPWIGLSWRGGARLTRAQLRSIPLNTWHELLRGGAQFISLQYGDCAEEVKQFNRDHGLNVRHWPDVLVDYDETAALVTALNLVVSVCTSIVHLCGALGRPVLVLTPATPEWRYLGSGRRMPWYPSATLYRQCQGEPWDDVLRRLAMGLPLASGRLK